MPSGDTQDSAPPATMTSAIAVLDHARGQADRVQAGGAGRDDAMLGPLKPNLIDTWPGDHVDDRGRHEERRNAARAAIDQLGMRLLDHRQTADARADVHSRCGGQLIAQRIAGRQPLSGHRLEGRGQPRWMNRSMCRASFSGM
jgi:hypothetical protein